MQTRSLKFSQPPAGTAKRPDEPCAATYGVRVKRDVFARSSIGAILPNRTSGGANHNRAGGADANFRFFEKPATANLCSPKPRRQVCTVRTGRGAGEQLSTTIFIAVELAHLDVGRNFNPEIGFVPRLDQRTSTANFQIKPRPKHGPVRQFQFSSESITPITTEAFWSRAVGTISPCELCFKAAIGLW